MMGWKATGANLPDLKKYLMIVGPHTSGTDFFIGLAFRSVLHLEHARFLGKKELFKAPFGFIFRWLGGTPVDRFSKQNMVDQVVELFNDRERLVLALSPEGTREKVDRLRTGFYYIAKKAGIPIVMIGLEYGRKELIISESFFTTGNEAEDFRKIIAFFAPLQGKIPANGMKHLEEALL
jgi:1-acyl-sn-glycerol-3-phosphate acyltransferase